MENNNNWKSKEMSDKTFRNYFFLITFGICLLVALLNIKYLLGYFGLFVNIITPVLIGLGIAFILNIPMSFIETHLLGFMKQTPKKERRFKLKKNRDLNKGKRVIAITLTFIFVIGILAGLITFVIPQVSESVDTLIVKLPDYITSFNALMDDILAFLNLPETLWNDITTEWDALLEQFGSLLLSSVPEIFNATKSITVGFFNAIMGVVISIYLLADKENLLALKDKLIYAYVKKDQADFISDVSTTANQVFHGFIAGQITEAFILGTLCTVGLAILQIPYALLIGVMVGMTSVIPVFGAFLGAVPSGFILLVVNPIYCLIFVVYIIVLQQVESNVIYPRVVGGSIGLSGLWVLVGMLIGGSLFGFLGIILGIPSFAVFYAVFRKVTNERIDKMKARQEEPA
ncbi:MULTISPECIES: AI-2E family transporter [unclassified Acetobacterium]|uniref:AI-2E family transporter n=1 Tax=unclassified Acetobacterium TaxID=2638182 RepID=UPI000DBEB9C2|nr:MULTISPECIES: AI-2E family transporter [unclassified Acetobacterium]AWW26696.1 AI-2E family transporter [Acetobacterium sp. KB-1]MDZ5725360.1 AI-2E family transporter [Acetobacterium sp. K1/6]